MVDGAAESSYSPSFSMEKLSPSFHALHAAIQQSSRILLCAHQKPDGDTLGASSSVLNWLIREGKDVRAFCASHVPPEFRYLDQIHRYESDPAVFNESFDLIIVFDSGDLRYCGIEEFVLGISERPPIANIDHHHTNARYGDMNLVDTEASSTAEIVGRFYDACGIDVDHRMATSVLTGLITDTGNFSNGATNARALHIASRMIERGGRHRDIHEHVNNRHTIPSLRLMGRVLHRLRSHPTHDIAVTYIRAEDTKNLPEGSASGISNFLQGNLGEHETVLVLHETEDGYVRGSLRSMSKDISKLAGLFGGGGHTKASGFRIRGRIEETPQGPKIV